MGIFILDFYPRKTCCIAGIRKVTPSGVVTTVVDEVNGDFAYPTGVCVDPTGIIYVMDTYAFRIRKIIFE